MIENQENIEQTTVENNALPQPKQHNKKHFILFWIIFFLIIRLIVIKGVYDLTEVMTLNAAFTEKQYTAADVDELTAQLDKLLEAENSTMHPGYRLDITRQPSYAVYSADTGMTAMVVYCVRFNGQTYSVVGYTSSLYFNGLNTIIEARNKIIEDQSYTWDNNYIPEEGEQLPVVEPTAPPTHTEDGTPITSEIDDENIVIERGGSEDEEETDEFEEEVQ